MTINEHFPACGESFRQWKAVIHCERRFFIQAEISQQKAQRRNLRHKALKQ